MNILWFDHNAQLTNLRAFVYVDEVPHCTTVRVPKIQTIYGVVGILKLLAGDMMIIVLMLICNNHICLVYFDTL